MVVTSGNGRRDPGWPEARWERWSRRCVDKTCSAITRSHRSSAMRAAAPPSSRRADDDLCPSLGDRGCTTTSGVAVSKSLRPFPADGRGGSRRDEVSAIAASVGMVAGSQSRPILCRTLAAPLRGRASQCCGLRERTGEPRGRRAGGSVVLDNDHHPSQRGIDFFASITSITAEDVLAPSRRP